VPRESATAAARTAVGRLASYWRTTVEKMVRLSTPARTAASMP
jgi:hypothetical protein